jgi:hypothetical protein
MYFNLLKIIFPTKTMYLVALILPPKKLKIKNKIKIKFQKILTMDKIVMHYFQF